MDAESECWQIPKDHKSREKTACTPEGLMPFGLSNQRSCGVPTSAHAVRHILGFDGYYCQFMPNLAPTCSSPSCFMGEHLVNGMSG